MIPKIIHYCWFGSKKLDECTNNYVHSWKEILPDYQIVEWNESNFNVEYNRYVKEAYELKKYAFVSDVCRLYALQQMGGIYLDTDVQVIKKFDSFLHDGSFIGEEQNGKLVGTAVIGAEPGTPWINEFLAKYDSLTFKKRFGALDTTANTERLTKFFIKHKEVAPKIYPIEYFCAKDYKTGSITQTPNTVCIHHYAASWVEPLKFEKYEKKFWSCLGLKNLNILGKIHGRILTPLKKLFFCLSL